MIHGSIRPKLEPRIPITFLDAADVPLTLDLAIDTAFAGFLALPGSLIAHLAIPLIGNFSVELADGTFVQRPYYLARVEWQSGVREVRAVELGPDPLVGINFFWGQRITMDIVVGGPVTIEPIP